MCLCIVASSTRTRAHLLLATAGWSRLSSAFVVTEYGKSQVDLCRDHPLVGHSGPTLRLVTEWPSFRCQFAGVPADERTCRSASFARPFGYLTDSVRTYNNRQICRWIDATARP